MPGLHIEWNRIGILLSNHLQNLQDPDIDFEWESIYVGHIRDINLYIVILLGL